MNPDKYEDKDVFTIVPSVMYMKLDNLSSFVEKKKENTAKQHGRKRKIGEIVDQKKMKKLQRNREAAQKFRQKERDHIAQLEKCVEQLTMEQSIYKAAQDFRITERNLLSEQIAYLRNFISHALEITYGEGIPKECSQYMLDEKCILDCLASIDIELPSFQQQL